MLSQEKCVGCGTCIEKCPMEAINMFNSYVKIHENKCIGCGVCAYHCPEDALKLVKIKSRKIFIPPPKILKESKIS